MQKPVDHKNINADFTTADVVIQFPYLRRSMEQLGIDYCCGGHRTLAEAAERAGVNIEEVLKELRESELPANAKDNKTDWTAVSLTELTDHIINTHHVFTRKELERCAMLLGKVVAAHGATHGALLEDLSKEFSELKEELDSHLLKEERILFPVIKVIEAYVRDGGPRPERLCGSVANPIQQMILEHDHAGESLAGMRRITDGYKLPADACRTFESLYDGLAELEDDLHQHIHLENNILFPAAIELEKEHLCD